MLRQKFPEVGELVAPAGILEPEAVDGVEPNEKCLVENRGTGEAIAAAALPPRADQHVRDFIAMYLKKFGFAFNCQADGLQVRPGADQSEFAGDFGGQN